MNRRRELFFGREGHEAKNREFLCQYLNRPPFNRKDQQEYRQLSPENASPPRRNFDFTENSGVRPKRKSSRRMDYYQPFQHIAYIERIRKVQNLERERRARSTSPRLPRIVHLQNNTSLNVKKIENHWKNLQIKRALQNEIEETKELKNEIADNDSRTFEEPKQSQKLLMDGNIDTISTLKIVDDLIESEEATEEKLKNDQNAISYFSKESKNAARRCKSTSSIKTVKQFKIAEGPTSTHYRSRPKPPHRPPGKGLMLIESIKRMVMYNSNDRNDNTDEDDSGWSEDVTMKFPKETRNAVAFMLNKSKESPPSVPLQNSETQTSPTGSKINMADQYDDNKKIPCPKDILCAKGLHAGECSRSSRTKNLIVHRKETWPGRAFRVTEETPVVSVKDLTRDKKESFLSLMEPLRVSVKEAVEKLEPLLNGKPETPSRNTLRDTVSKMNGLNGHTNGDLNGCGDIITQNQQKGCWTIGLINSKFRYLTAETFGFKINANGSSLKKKQIWTLEPDLSNTADSVIYLRSHLDKYLAVDSFGNITCESEERDPGSKFQISVAEDGSGRWALRNVVRGYFLGSTSDKLTCTAKVPSDAEFWHVHLAARPQVNLRSVGRKRFAHLSENLDEIHVDANIPWGEDTLFTLEFRADEGGKYALHTCNNKYLSNTGKLVDVCNKDCLFSAEYHSGQLALRDRNGAYLSPIGSKAVLKTRSQTVTKDELFSLEDSLPQASFVAALNSKFVSVKQGVDVTANQDEISDHETFQLEFDWSTKRWYIRTMQDKYWTLETGGGIQAAGDKRSSNALFDLIWQGDGSVAFRANNGRYVITKRSGHLYATSDTIDDNCKYYFYLVNRPILVLKCEQGFVGHKSSNNPKLECNKATYETIQVERSDKGVVYFKGQNGKYWHADSESVTADSDVPEGFYLELREPTRLCIKTVAGYYLTASKNGCFRLGDSSIENATQWEY